MSWWAPDEGVYAYVADRLLNGAVLNRDVHDIHGGYIHFVNASALKLFGRDLVSLRYPLAILTMAQAAIMFSLLRSHGRAVAIVGTLAMSSLTFVQFPNPTANWYGLFFSLIVACALQRGMQRTYRGILVVGFLLAIVFCFRQLTGVFAAIGALTYIIASATPTTLSTPRLARICVLIMGIGIVSYLWHKADGIASALYGATPIMMLAFAAKRTRLPDLQTIKLLSVLLAGALLGMAPLLLYHLLNGSSLDALDDLTNGAIALTNIDFFTSESYSLLLSTSVEAIGSGEIGPICNGIYWIIVLGLSSIVGVLAFHQFRNNILPHPLVFLASGYGLVAVHYAIPLYAIYPVAILVSAWLLAARTERSRRVAIFTGIFLVFIGVVFHAGQSLERGYAGVVRGVTTDLMSAGIPGASLRISQADQDRYELFLNFIAAHAEPSDQLLGLPMAPELNFLSGRSSPVKYAVAPFGLHSQKDQDAFYKMTVSKMPAVIVYQPNDKYTTLAVRQLMDKLRAHYTLCLTHGNYQFYSPTCTKL